ncbi:MAG: trypsin-like peptidase domain-containing protein [Lachnospiraceae bacterium]|nr:trypsin-like peptidase domain-containing protein [Lachnospiraceae bacterium]
MYESFDYESESANAEKKPTIDEIKAQEKALRAERLAQKKAEKRAKKLKNKGIRRKIYGTLGLACLFGVVASFVFHGSNYIFDKTIGKKTEATTQNEDVKKVDKIQDVAPPEEKEVIPEEELSKLAPVNTTGMGDVTQVAEKAMPSIVAITNKSVQEVMSFFGAGVQQYEAQSAGSGIIIGKNDTELLIATNAHVVEGAQTLTVCFIDEKVCEATVKGSDKSNDIAVISVPLNDVEGSTLDAIKVAKLGDSDSLVIGEQVVAIGNALGYGQSVTTGIISALDRDITDDNVDNSYIQTDAAINPGNSGGALLNMNCELVGINSAKLANTKIEGMGYAIPIAAAKPIMDDIMNRVTRELVDEADAGYVGISGFSVTQDVSKQYGIPVGIYVSEVTSGAAAEKAGIHKGDIITEFDGMSVDSIKKLREQLDYYRAGETVDITLYRADDGQYVEKTFKITLDGRKGTPLDVTPSEDTEETPESDRPVEKNGPSGDFRDYINPGNGRSIFDFFGY